MNLISVKKTGIITIKMFIPGAIGRREQFMNTLSYIKGSEEEIVIGGQYYFGQLWDGEGDGDDLLESGAIAIWDSDDEKEIIVSFEAINAEENIMDTFVKVTDIY